MAEIGSLFPLHTKTATENILVTNIFTYTFIFCFCSKQYIDSSVSNRPICHYDGAKIDKDAIQVATT